MNDERHVALRALEKIPEKNSESRGPAGAKAGN